MGELAGEFGAARDFDEVSGLIDDARQGKTPFEVESRVRQGFKR